MTVGRILTPEQECVTDAFTCHLCHKKLTVLTRTKEHIVPRAMGGLDIRWNITMACRACNSAKSNTFPWCSCSQCSRTRRRHWEMFRIRDPERDKVDSSADVS